MSNNAQKELNKPDGLQERMFSFLNFIRKNKKYIYIGIAAAVGIMIIGTGWHFYRMDYEKKAQNAYDETFSAYHFTTDTANVEKSIANIIDRYKDIISKYPHSRAASLSLYSLGNLYYQIKEYDKSIDAYSNYIKSTSKMKELKSLAYNGLGYCYEAKGEDDMALESYEKAVKGAMEGAFSGMIYQNIARLYEKMKNNDKALEYYKKTAAQNTDPLTKVLVRRKIAELAPSK